MKIRSELFYIRAQEERTLFGKACRRLLAPNQTSSASVTDVNVEGKWKRIRSSYFVRSKAAALKRSYRLLLFILL